jgi:hypothetical protein
MYGSFMVDLQLPMQSVPITTKVVSSNPTHGEVYSIQQLHNLKTKWRVKSYGV